MIVGAARPRRVRAVKAQCREVELVDVGLDHPHRVVLGNVIIDATRQQPMLPPVLTFDDPLMRTPG
jgi:hypothetical protein